MTTTDTTAAQFVTCTCGQLVPAEGKHVHCCIQRVGRKIVSREYVGFLDGRPVNYGADFTQVTNELNGYVYEQLARTTAETADIAADAAEAGACETCRGEGRYAAYGWGDQAGGFAQTCDDCGGSGKAPIDPPTPDPTPSGDPWPDSYTIPTRFSVNLRQACLICGGDHSADICPRINLRRDDETSDGDQGGPTRPRTVADLLAEADAVLLAAGCAACGGRHDIQQCPTIRGLLLAPDAERMALTLVERMAAA